MSPEYYRQYREKNKERIFGVKKEYREGDKREEILEKKRKWHAEKVDRYWLQVVEGYGGKCSRCPEGRPEGLLIHHKNRDGKEHRKLIKCTIAWRFHRWIIENKFPDYLELLCGTCHLIHHRADRFHGDERREE